MNGVAVTLIPYMCEKVMNESYLDELNSRQRLAVEHGVKDGKARAARPLLIIAGAGTGKTKTLAARATHLLVNGADPESVLAASFTKRSSKELIERIRAYYAAATGMHHLRLPYAGTFHSVAVGLLHEFAVELGLRPNFTLYDKAQAEDLMELVRVRSGQPAKNKLFPRKERCLALHSYRRNACLSVAQAIDEQFPDLKEWRRELRQLLADYDLAKREQGVLDFDDLLMKLAAALDHPSVGPALRRRFKFVLVDEFQDTNRLQLKILRRLRPSGRGVTVVGDDAQAIYSFRAATVENIRRFENCFECKARIVSLERNYRSTQPILTASNAVMALSQDAFEKKLFSKRRSERLPTITTVDDEAGQAKHVVGQIIRAREEGIPLREQAVLFRASAHSAQLEGALNKARIPFQKWGGLKFVDSAHIRDVLAVLRWWENPHDQGAGLRVLELIDGIGKKTAADILEQINPRRLAKSLRDCVVPRAAEQGWRALRQLFRARGGSEHDWSEEIKAVMAWYRPYLDERYDDPQGRLADLDQLAEMAAGFSSRRQMLTELALEPPDKIGRADMSKHADDDVLTLSTIHSAKGHEWRSVTLLSAVEGCMPLGRVTRSEELEEERRLLYVAITRPKDRLEIMMPRRVFLQRARGGSLYMRSSRFLPESIQRHFQRR